MVTGAGVGYARWMPGTVGTLLALLPSLGLNHLAGSAPFFAGLLLLLAIAAAIPLATRGAHFLKAKDPGAIVIDEILGFLVANFAAPLTLPVLIVALLLFRFFDIVKIVPISHLEKLPGGTGIILDDVMAGIYTYVALRLLLYWEIL
ncbi:MAG: phosphatidylglycerophosphatase A [Deltaproteobacteria bacterium]|nr:phosphatidylglycerophosphatase A [Deltaproteobacteria bacterium]MBM4297463.1 phosphatidylglycerophosphatase A [Deltaproteobacteria bacterium]